MKLAKVALLAGALVLAGGNKANWNNTVVETDAGHLIGNPDAETKLTEYVSYTCSHCANFAKVGDPVLKVGYVHSGKVSVEIRHSLRDPVDLTATMLTHCGAASKFTLNHNAIMYSQQDWMPILQSATQAQIARWTNTDRAAARRAIASDFGFYKLMEGRGYRITDLDKCLNNDAKAESLVKASVADGQRLGIEGTPSFAINGKLLDHTHSWPALQQQLDAHLQGASASN